jgi:mono/diheme cytochrome c family protein
MSQEGGDRQLTPREPGEVGPSQSPLTPVEGDSRDVERFSARPQVHSVQLTEERSAQIVRQSANARNVVFLAILLIALFIPVYWFYESGVPALGTEGRLAAEADAQYVTDVARGYELYIANCAECHGAEGQGGIGPPLNDQAKLYNVLTPAGEPGSGHLNPIYLDNVLTVGGRYICGDPNSLMAPWLEPRGPLNYRQVEELIVWMTASNEIIFEHEPESHGEGEEHEAEVIAGWRDPNWQPGPDDTPPPACWKAPAGLAPAATTTTPAPADGAATPAPADPDATTAPIAGGSADAPRVIRLDANASLQFTDESGNVVSQIDAVPGEVIQFVVDNTAGFDHNLWIGTPDVLSVPNAETEVGIPTWQSGEQTLTWTVPDEAGTLEFACTVPGHYTTMRGNIVIQG